MQKACIPVSIRHILQQNKPHSVTKRTTGGTAFFYFRRSAGHFPNDILQCYVAQLRLYAITASRRRLDNQPNFRNTNLTMRKLVGIATQYTGTGASTALTPNQMKRFSNVICRR